MMRKLSIIIPAYNEEHTIAEVIARAADVALGGIEKEIIVVDDGSGDATGETAAHAEKSIKNAAVRLVSHDQNRGKGAAIKTGLFMCTGDYALIQDADMECDPEDYPALIAPILKGEADMVCGSRILNKNNAPKNAFYYYGGVFLSRLFNAMFRTSFTDITGCYKVFPRRVIPSLLTLPSDDFVFDAVELPYALSRSGRIKEVPVRYAPRARAQGKKLHWTHGARCVPAMVRLKFFKR